MEAKQFYTCSISPLVTKTFACKWSEDNQFSIITEKGVHIIEILPSPTQTSPLLNLSRSFFYSPETLPCKLYTNNIFSQIFTWNKDEVYSFLLQDAITPNFPKTVTTIPEVFDIFWSPQNLFHPHKCLIAILTSVGALELAVSIDRNWISVFQLSSLWTTIIDQDMKDIETSNELDPESVKRKLYRLVVTTAVWSNLYYTIDRDSFAYLITAHRNSEIVIWKINTVSSNIFSLDINIKVDFKFKKLLFNENIRITTLFWIDLNKNIFLLVIGLFNGQIGVIKLQEFEEGITSNSYKECYPTDNIPVDYFNVLQQTDKHVEVVAVKGMYLLILKIDIAGQIIYTKFISSPGLSITGVSIIDKNMIFISTQDGKFCIIKKSKHKQELICVPINIDIPKINVQYLGLANSTNKLMFVILTSPSIIYDHLIDREPSIVYFFNFPNEPLLDPINIISRSKTQTLTKYWDAIELIKVNALKYNNIAQILTQVVTNVESLSLFELRLAFWVMTINVAIKKKNQEEIFKSTDEIEQVRLYIFLHTASKHLTNLALKQNLTETQVLCMSLLKNHLEIWLAGEEEEVETPVIKYVKHALKTISKFNLNKQEKCNFCDNVITEPWLSTCSIGHKLPRCSITCLQVTCTKYRSCMTCQEIFHPSLDSEIKEVMCLYCELPVFYKYSIKSSLLQAFKVNLSKKKVSTVKSKECKEIDM